jgi:hypothetical protein
VVVSSTLRRRLVVQFATISLIDQNFFNKHLLQPALSPTCKSMEQKKWNKGAGLSENSSTPPKFVCIVPTPQTSISINEFLII